MKAAGWAMGSPGRFAAAEKALGIGRVLAGRKQRISTLPWPGSRWTNARDLPAPPAARSGSGGPAPTTTPRERKLGPWVQ